MTYINKIKHDEKLLPDFIFLDINIPSEDAWNFLSQFEKISPTLPKDVVIYIVSVEISLANQERLKYYAKVKGVIDKDRVEFSKYLKNEFGV